ncbi:MAG: LysM peptidoglycan-binding domain-containing protein [Bacilli bacterium]|nr:LysM peptidoglycan-binding domain-containing protein [Bacilli bacterium]
MSEEINLLTESPVLERPTIKEGDQGSYVSLLQTQLKELKYYNGNIDGNFNATTAASVKTFQTNNKLTSDGVVGKDTWSALIYLYSPLAICGTSNYHIVVAGDTLWNLARKYNTTVAELKRLNNLTSDSLSIGQRLIVTGTPEVPIEEPSGNTIHTVVAGDTLWDLARKYNTTVAEIKRLNNLTSDSLSIGQKLIVAGTPEVPIEEPSDNTIHTVVAGDTLWDLARKYNTTVAELKRLNNLTSDSLSIGQKLIITGTPGESTTNNSHIVRSGDTLWNLAKTYNTTVAELKRLNNLKSDALSIGQVLQVK